MEIFQDGDRETPLEPALFPGAALLRRGPGRRDFHEAYNEAVQRAETPYLGFIDSDVFWTTPDLWPWARQRLERRYGCGCAKARLFRISARCWAAKAAGAGA